MNDGREALCGVDDGREALRGVDGGGGELCSVDDGGEALCGVDVAPASLGTAATREPHASRAALPQGSQAGSCARRYASNCSQPKENNIVCIPQCAQTWTSMLKSETAPPACMHGTTSHSEGSSAP